MEPPIAYSQSIEVGPHLFDVPSASFRKPSEPIADYPEILRSGFSELVEFFLSSCFQSNVQFHEGPPQAG